MAVDSAFFSSNDPVWVWSIRQSAAVDDKIPAPGAATIEPRTARDKSTSTPAAAQSWPRVYPRL